MSDMSRKEAIENLKEKRHELIEFWEDYKHENHEVQALDIAIASLEADEAYQLEYERTTKNDLGVDCIDRNKAYEIIESWAEAFDVGTYFDNEQVKEIIMACANRIDELPSVTPQEPQTFKWCTNCKEYDQEKHCCHRYSKVIRDTVEEMKQEQEPKTGYWIEEFIDTEGEVRFTCSCCGKYQLFGTDFCYNCGAKMIEPQESEDKE